MNVKLSLIKQSVCPPNGFRYVFPGDGYAVVAFTYNDWVENARAHLRVNGLEVPADLAAVMEDQLCQTLEPGWCMYDDPMRPRVNTDLNWDDVKVGLVTFGKWLAVGCATVEQAEAERRASICARCYMNVAIGGCSACQKVVSEVVGKRKTKLDGVLRACAVCRCVLRAKVWFPQNALASQNEKGQSLYPGHCWLKKGGENFVSGGAAAGKSAD